MKTFITPPAPLPSHLSAFEGCLWKGNSILRGNYDNCPREITAGRELRAALRHGDSTFPGCYPLYFLTSDGAALSFKSVRENLAAVLWSIRHGANDGWRVVAVEVNYEDGELACEHSGEPIGAAYV